MAYGFRILSCCNVLNIFVENEAEVGTKLKNKKFHFELLIQKMKRNVDFQLL